MIHSLNEIESLCTKAARGAGLPWGFAEEAGKAARWLASHRLPALEPLAGMLDLIERRSLAAFAPVQEDNRWQGRDGLMCALTAGVALCDRAETLAAGERFETGPIAHPLLVAPFVAAAQRATGRTFGLQWQGASMGIDTDGLHLAPNVDLSAREADGLSCKVVSDPPIGQAIASESGGVDLDPACWRRLGAYAQRTYVVASEASRERGAGAGLDDND